MANKKILDIMKQRRSVRSFKPGLMPKKVLKEILDCARFAPTARNEQPWEFVVVTSKDMLVRLGNLTDHGKFIKDCSCCVVVLSHPTKYFLEDGSAATMNIIHAAESFAIKSCWVAGHKKAYVDKVKNLLGVPDDLIVISLVALGYSDEQPSVSKKPLEDIMHLEKY